MKKYSILILFVSIIIPFSKAVSAEYGYQSNLKWTPSSPQSVTQKANQAPSYSSPYSGFNDGFVNSTIRSYSSIMQSASGGYASQAEEYKQQADYAKQQVKNSQEDL